LWQATADQTFRTLKVPNSAPLPAGLKTKAVRTVLANLLPLPVVLFIPAGTVKFWQAWAYITVSVVYALCVVLYFYNRDPQALARRMLRSEKILAQKFLIFMTKGLWIFSLVLTGLDFRFGWTRAHIGPIPWWLSVVALAIIMGADIWFIAVLKANSFAASIIQVEEGQIIVASGPYRMVRHPMYLGFIVRWLAAPLALGSLVTMPVFSLIVPFMTLRLLNEEKFLHRELPGYSDYCRQVTWRLIPFVW
jgi:protein-S-isoprenylcysteine O-methyltransferase Ste14